MVSEGYLFINNYRFSVFVKIRVNAKLVSTVIYINLV